MVQARASDGISKLPRGTIEGAPLLSQKICGVEGVSTIVLSELLHWMEHGLRLVITL